MTAHRQPCFPPSYDANRQNGNCKWCNEPLPRKKDGGISRSWFWHGPCGDAHALMTDLGLHRRALLERDGDLCADCGLPACGPLEIDHVVPLWSVDRQAPEAAKYWTVENLQLLGQPCHKKKSALEAKQRAKEKRIRKRLNGERRERPKIQSQPFWKPPGFVHKIQSRPLRGRGL